jgi:predicted dehydrogenase
VESAIRTGAPPPVSVEEAVASLTVVEAALRSGKERRIVTL